MSDLYKEAANLLRQLEKRKGGLKSLAYAENIVHKRSSFALVCETLRYKPLLKELITSVPDILKMQKKSKDTSLLYISLYDLLFGHKKIQGGGHLKRELLKYANALRESLVRKKIKAKVAHDEDLLPPENRKQELQLPRYVRINTLLATQKDIDMFVQEHQAKRDVHIKDLLVLPPGTELHEHELVKSGKIILQDKASCFPAYILHGEHSDDLEAPGDVIDACAAPGNKTSHLAMLFQQRDTKYPRHIFAFDRSPKRLELLQKRMELAGANHIVDACLHSFLDVDVNASKYANVKSILLDPSCSGSGMTNRLDHLLDIASNKDRALEPQMDEYEEDVAQRLQSLADFQLKALLKAFSFTHVQRVVYSTCSIFEKENEEVVVAALQSDINITHSNPFQLKKCLVTWPRRGIQVDGLSSAQAECLVRASGLEDHTNGFFVAYFERTTTECSREPSNITSQPKKRKKRSQTQKKDRKLKKRKRQQSAAVESPL